MLQQPVVSATALLPEQQEQSVQTHTAPWQHPQHWQVWQPHEPLATTGVVGARARAAQSRKLVMGKILGKVKTGSNRYHRTMRRHIRQKPAGFWDSTDVRLTATEEGSRQRK